MPKKTKKKINPDYGTQIPKLKKVTGQVEGIELMIQQNRYCPLIINQIRAARFALLAIEASILETHLKKCVTDAFLNRNKNIGMKKIEEIIQLFKKAASKGVKI